MVVLSKETGFLLNIISCSVSGEIPELPADGLDWNEIIKLSKAQELCSLVWSCLKGMDVPGDVAENLNNYAKSELVHMIALKNELKQIERQLEQNGIRFMLLKGSRIKDYYPKESMRQMSDIDILYDDSMQEKLVSIMRERGYSRTSDGGNSDDFSKAPFYTFEFHRELFKDVYGFFPDFSFVWENAVQAPDNACKYIMSVEDLYIHSVAHMYKHYLFGGFGLRFLVDTYLILEKNPGLDTGYISKRTEELGLREFEEKISALSYAIMRRKDLTESQEQFVSQMIETGIFGHDNTNVQEAFSRFEKESGTNAKSKYFFRRLFPKKEKMYMDFPVLTKKPYLLGLYYLYRMTRGIRKKDRVLKEIKTVNNINVQNEDK